MRVAPSPLDEKSSDPLVKAIVARRGGALIDLDRALLYSPSFANGWNVIVGAMRSELSLPARLGELAMYAVAALHGSEFEKGVHGPLYLKAGGKEAGLRAADALRSGVQAGLPRDEAAILAVALAVTRDVRVNDTVFAELKAALPNDQQLVEAIGLISAFNMVTRFILALDIFP